MTHTSTRPTSDLAGAEPSVRPGSGAMFDRIADRYDLINRILTGGLDARWRRLAVDALDLAPGALDTPGSARSTRVLDVATGTADLALEAARRLPGARITGLDPSEEMLAVGRRKVDAAKLGERIELVPGEAESLPFDDDTFDGTTIAWGIRNVADRPAALREMARVTKPGGRVAILEATEARGLLAVPARFYVRHVVPWIGTILSRQAEYRYLQRSIAAFPSPEDFARMMAANDLQPIDTISMISGVCHLFVATPGPATNVEGKEGAR